MILEVSPHLVEALASRVVNAFGLSCYRYESAGQVDRKCLGCVAVLGPVCIEDLLSHMRRQQRRQGVQISDRHAALDRHARRSRELHTPLPNGGGLQGSDASSAPASAHLGQTLKA